MPASRPVPRPVHPGYGFLSEREAFAEALKAAASSSSAPIPAPSPPSGRQDRIEESGGNGEGLHGTGLPRAVIESPEHAVQIADEIGYPVMIKASAGGGGKGMRVAHSADEVAEGFARAKSGSGFILR